MTGARYERETVDRLDAAGYAAIRIPSSGSRTDRDLPDVLAGRPVVYPYGPHDRIEIEDRGDVQSDRFAADALAIEVKSGQAPTLYADAAEVAALERFADRFGARAFLAARSTQRGTPTATFLVAPADARRTDEGNYGLPVDGIDERASVVLEDGP